MPTQAERAVQGLGSNARKKNTILSEGEMCECSHPPTAESFSVAVAPFHRRGRRRFSGWQDTWSLHQHAGVGSDSLVKTFTALAKLLVPIGHPEVVRINRAVESVFCAKTLHQLGQAGTEPLFLKSSLSTLLVPVPALLSPEFQRSTVIKNMR